MVRKKLKKLTFAAIAALAIISCPRSSAAIVTTIYEFVPDQSTVAVYGRIISTYPIEGQFQLTVDYDADIASFDQVNATISEEIHFYDYFGEDPVYTDNLDVIFHMTEMVSTSVSETEIDFLFEKDIPGFSPYADVHLTLTFLDNSVQLTGYFTEPVADGRYFLLDAVAVPEPASILILAFGGLIVRRRFFPNKKSEHIKIEKILFVEEVKPCCKGGFYTFLSW